jgi:superfamily II DNA or RNA helicase
VNYIPSGGIRIPKSRISIDLSVEDPASRAARTHGNPFARIEKIEGFILDDEDHLIVPFGVPALCGAEDLYPSIIEDWPIQDLPESIRLRPYQRLAVDRMVDPRARCGIIVMPPGAGKTFTALSAIAQRGDKALILVHTKDLMDQWCEAAASFFQEPARKIGGGTVELPGTITVAMVQTLATWNFARLNRLASLHRTLILDEAHHAPASTFFGILWHLGTPRRFALTATPKRADGLTPILRWCFGPILYEVTNEDLVDAGVAVKPRVHRVDTTFAFDLPKISDWRGERTDTKALAECYRTMCADQDRLELIAKIVIRSLQENRKVLVLAGRVEHCRLIAETIEDLGGPEAIVLTAKISMKKRRAGLEAFKAGTPPICIATTLADEGLDVPDLEVLIQAFPARSEARTIQRVGRTMRSCPGKERPIIVDVVDAEVGLFLNQWYARRRAYKIAGCEIATAVIKSPKPEAAKRQLL